jgi:hypothetical protein
MRDPWTWDSTPVVYSVCRKALLTSFGALIVRKA